MVWFSIFIEVMNTYLMKHSNPDCGIMLQSFLYEWSMKADGSSKVV